MIDVERALEDVANRLELPSTEWLVSDVVRRINARPVHATPRRAPRLVALVALAAVVVVIVAPGPRHAVARWLGFDSVHIQPDVTVPTSKPAATPPALGLGPAVSMAAAIAATHLPDPSPSLLGAPLSVHVVQPPASGQIVVVYAPSDLVPQSNVTGAGAVVSVMPAHIEEGFFGKTLGATATERSVDVGGATGYWIEGSPHQLLFQFGEEIMPDTLRLATNTLLWQVGEHVYRIEADTDLATALRIAASVRSVP